MTFVIDSLNFSLLSLKKIVIYKNNSMYISINPRFDILIFPSWNSRLDKFLQLENKKEDELTSSTYQLDEIKVDMLDFDLRIEKEKKEIYSNLTLSYV